MTKTIGKSRTTKFTNQSIAHDVEKIIRKAMLETAGSANLKRKLQNFLADSLDHAKEKTNLIHRDVAKYTYKKPYRSLGLAVLTGAVIGIVVGNTLRKD